MPPAGFSEQCTVAVVGAGPAGMAAATLAAELGLDAALIDARPRPAGRTRAAIAVSPDPGLLFTDSDARRALRVDALARAGARFIGDAAVVSVARNEVGFEIALAVDGKPATIRARKLIVAAAEQDRPFPIPGWSLPGVMTAGEAQAGFMSAGRIPSGRTMLAGCGPFIYLVAWQLLQAGVELVGIVDTLQRSRLFRALPYAWGFARSPYYKEQAAILQEINERVALFRGATAIAALGNERLASVRFVANGTATTLLTDELLLHQGFVPDVALSGALGCDHRWDGALMCWKPRVDRWGASSIADIYIAGDAAGMADVVAAEHRGRLAAVAAAATPGSADTREARAAPDFAGLARASQGRAFNDTLYLPAKQFRIASGATIVCRCEGVAAQDIVAAVRDGCDSSEMIRTALRCGAGRCQGRLCGLPINELIARERGVRPCDTEMLRARFPMAPAD